MELDKLKTAWDKVSSGNENRYSEEQVEKLLKKRTKDITGNIKRNIYIGLGIVLAYVTISIIASLYTSPLLDNFIGKNNSELVVFWGSIVDTIIYILIIGSLIAFWTKFNKLQNHYNRNASLEQNISQQINLIKWYRKMFYMVLIIILVVVVAGFTTGFVMSFNQGAEQSGLSLANAGFLMWAFIALAFIISLSILLGIYYLLFNLFFIRLYGRQLIRLTETLNELQEPESE
jgi:MFS family permease